MTTWLATLRNILYTKELRTRLFHTFFYVVVFRIGTFIVLPGLDPTRIRNTTSSFLQLLDILLNSSSLRTSSIFSLGIAPYISASIVIQIVSLTIPYFQRLKKEGPSGRNQLNQYTRYLTLFIAPFQCIGYIGYLVNSQAGTGMIMIPSRYFMILSILTLTTGTMFCVWLADRISAKGLGSGSSVLITASIISGLPGALYMEYDNTTLLFFIIETLVLFAIILVTITFMQGVRRIPLQYASQMVGPQATYRGARQYLPIGLNTAGVMPIIFAQTITALPLIAAKSLAKRSARAGAVAAILQNQYSWQYNLILGTLIFMGTFFYASIFVNATEMADELKRSNGFIPGVKSGKNTAEYIDSILSKVTLPGSLFLVLVALTPVFAFKVIHTTEKMSRFFGGTSLLITIGVILDISQRIQSHLLSTQYNSMLQAPHTSLIQDK